MLRSLELILPPSVNELYQNRKGSYKRILKDEGRDYIYVYSMEIRSYLRKIQHKKFEGFFYLDIDWVLPNRNCDSHNFEKALFDMLEKAEFTKNDKFIMNRTQSIDFSTKSPKVTITWADEW